MSINLLMAKIIQYTHKAVLSSSTSVPSTLIKWVVRAVIGARYFFMTVFICNVQKRQFHKKENGIIIVYCGRAEIEIESDWWCKGERAASSPRLAYTRACGLLVVLVTWVAYTRNNHRENY